MGHVTPRPCCPQVSAAALHILLRGSAVRANSRSLVGEGSGDELEETGGIAEGTIRGADAPSHACAERKHLQGHRLTCSWLTSCGVLSRSLQACEDQARHTQELLQGKVRSLPACTTACAGRCQDAAVCTAALRQGTAMHC